MSESQPQVYDAIVVLGKNLGIGWNAEKIIAQREHLAPHGRVNADAGALLYNEGRTKKIIFSSGITVPGLPSEAQLMKDHVQRIWPSIPDEDIILEEVSKQTKGNAVEVAKVIQREEINPEKVGLVTMGFHMKRAQSRFREEGLDLDPLPSQKIVGEKFPNFIANYMRKGIYLGETIAEFGFRIIQSTPILREIAQAKVEKDRS